MTSRQTIFIPNFDLHRHYIQEPFLKTKIAYWTLLYEKVALLVEAISDIEIVIEALGSNAFQKLSDAGRLILVFDPQITLSIRNKRPHEESIRWSINYGGVAKDEEGMALTFDHFHQLCEKRFRESANRDAILSALSSSVAEESSHNLNHILATHFDLNIKGRVFDYFKNNSKKIEHFLMMEGPALASLAYFYRNVSILKMSGYDVDLTFLELAFGNKIQRRLSKYFVNSTALTSDLYDREKCLNSLRRINGCPAIEDEILKSDRAFQDLISLSLSPSATGFRAWLSNLAKESLSEKTEQEFVGRLIEIIKITGKSNWIGWGAQNTIGLVPVVGNILSAAWGAADERKRGEEGAWAPLIFAIEMRKNLNSE